MLFGATPFNKLKDTFVAALTKKAKEYGFDKAIQNSGINHVASSIRNGYNKVTSTLSPSSSSIVNEPIKQKKTPDEIARLKLNGRATLKCKETNQHFNVAEKYGIEFIEDAREFFRPHIPECLQNELMISRYITTKKECPHLLKSSQRYMHYFPGELIKGEIDKLPALKIKSGMHGSDALSRFMKANEHHLKKHPIKVFTDKNGVKAAIMDDIYFHNTETIPFSKNELCSGHDKLNPSIFLAKK